MKRHPVLFALLLILMSTSCKRDHVYYEGSNTATVIVSPDWSASGVHPNGVTVYAYNSSDGSLYKRFPPVSAQGNCVIHLSQGDYTLVVMNDTPEEFAGRLEIVGEDNLATLQARAVLDNNNCIVEPDTLAVARYDMLHISQKHLDYYWDKPDKNSSPDDALTVTVKPKAAISEVNIKVHVKGLKYARGTTVSYLRGMAAGYMIGAEKNSREEGTHAFILNHRVFDPGSDTDGTITAKLLSFGLPGSTANETGVGKSGNSAEGNKYYLEINFVLINGEAYPLSFDVSNQINTDVSLNLQLSLNLDLEIELPEVIGDDNGGGFDTEVSDWEDEIIDIPM